MRYDHSYTCHWCGRDIELEDEAVEGRAPDGTVIQAHRGCDDYAKQVNAQSQTLDVIFGLLQPAGEAVLA